MGRTILAGALGSVRGRDVIAKRFGQHALSLMELPHMNGRPDMSLIVIEDPLEGENSLIVLRVCLINAAGFEQGRQVREVRPLQHVDEFYDCIPRAAFDDVDLTEIENYVEVVGVELLRRVERFARLCQVSLLQKGNTRLQVA